MRSIIISSKKIILVNTAIDQKISCAQAQYSKLKYLEFEHHRSVSLKSLRKSYSKYVGPYFTTAWALGRISLQDRLPLIQK